MKLGRGENLVSSPDFHSTKTKRFTPPKFTKRSVFLFLFVFFAFYGEIWVELGEIPKPGENFVRNW